MPKHPFAQAATRFRARWAFMEGAAWAQGKSIEDLSMDELQELGDLAKQGLE